MVVHYPSMTFAPVSRTAPTRKALAMPIFAVCYLITVATLSFLCALRTGEGVAVSLLCSVVATVISSAMLFVGSPTTSEG